MSEARTDISIYYQGHGSLRFSFGDTVIYVDPYAGGGYDVPADAVLVTHEHFDHNAVDLPAKKPGCRVIRSADALAGGVYNSFSVGDVGILSVPACNRNHPINECVGYVLSFGGKKIYCAGDTSYTDFMSDGLPGMSLDVALLPTDGVYNMDVSEAARCAGIIGAKVSIPIHTKPGSLYDEAYAARFDAPGAFYLKPGETYRLK
ncbi:MAG: MBL fold metallo-hydrolase [Clostridia bacterium]|nr:MBL fold metallo-hydrolase [Clostridia bacterium]